MKLSGRYVNFVKTESGLEMISNSDGIEEAKELIERDNHKFGDSCL